MTRIRKCSRRQLLGGISLSMVAVALNIKPNFKRSHKYVMVGKNHVAIDGWVVPLRSITDSAWS